MTAIVDDFGAIRDAMLPDGACAAAAPDDQTVLALLCKWASALGRLDNPLIIDDQAYADDDLVSTAFLIEDQIAAIGDDGGVVARAVKLFVQREVARQLEG